jgi:hypothetical protein
MPNVRLPEKFASMMELVQMVDCHQPGAAAVRSAPLPENSEFARLMARIPLWAGPIVAHVARADAT